MVANLAWLALRLPWPPAVRWRSRQRLLQLAVNGGNSRVPGALPVNRQTISLGADRRGSIIDLRGSMLLAGPGRPGTGFRSEVIALSDSATGLVGRSVWTDEHGDQVFSELKGEGTAAKNHITGTLLDGTGRYAGATGSYEFSWRYVIEAEDGSIQGRAVGLKGRVRLGQPIPGGARP